MKSYDVRITTGEPVPDDVMVEHIAVALRDFGFAGKVDVKMARQHPFDGPEMFDDDKPGTSQEGGFLPPDPYPLTTRLIDELREQRRGND